MKKLICLLFLAASFSYQAQKAEKVGAVNIVVSDLERSVKFYTEVLEFTKIGEEQMIGSEFEQLFGVFGMNAKVAHLQLGEEKVDLVDFLTTGGSPVPLNQKSNDLIFQHVAIVVSDMEKAFKKLQTKGVEYVSTLPQTLPASIKPAAGIKAFYFHDPDNHNLELIYFPSDKGNLKWHKANPELFMGIDHTAIGISNTANSLKLYKDVLNLTVKGESFNKGTEQEHLNNVENASLHITGLGAKAGPGIEFLQYLVPGPGNKFPDNTRSDDLWNWFTIIECSNIETLYTALKKTYKTVSKSIVTINGVKQFVVRDSDGHALWIKETAS